MSTVHTRPYRGGTNDWITPKYIVDALGPFDLDPCACHLGQPWLHAPRNYSIVDDGLLQPWEGRVWLNPPYGPEAAEWLARLAEHGDGIALVFARTETQWFVEQVWNKARAILFLEGRPHFCTPAGARAKGNSGGPLCLVAYDVSNHFALIESGLAGALVSGWRTPSPSMSGGSDASE